MSKTIKYVECAHCGETVGTYYVTCPYCGYKLNKQKKQLVEIICTNYKKKGENTRRRSTNDQQTILIQPVHPRYPGK